MISLPIAVLSKLDFDDDQLGSFVQQFLHGMSHLEPSNLLRKKRVQICILTWNARGINTHTAFRKERDCLMSGLCESLCS